MPPIGYLNGQFSGLEEIRVSPEDRGFLFGDGVYEVIRVYNGTPAFWEDHFSRLGRSAGEIQLPLPFDLKTFRDILFQGIRESGYAEGKVYVQLTRGVAPRDHIFPATTIPTVFLSFREMSALPAWAREKGVSAITMPDIRWGRCDIKSLNLLPNVLAKQHAKEAGAFEALFLRDNLIMEGATSNLFIVRRGKMSTPLINNQVLAGVTQQHVMRLARGMGTIVECRSIALPEMMEADEVFLTGTTIELLPVVAIDGEKIGSGIPGPMIKELQEKFSSLVQAGNEKW